MTDTKRKDELVEEIRELRVALREMAVDLSHSKAQRDGIRNLLGSVYRRLRDGRDVLPSQMEALRRTRAAATLYEQLTRLRTLTPTDGGTT